MTRLPSAAAERPVRRLSVGQAVVILIAVSAAVRIVLAGLIGLGVDESYMVSQARDLSLSYNDHPPLHVWIVGVVAKLAGSENGLLLRLPFIALFAGSTWLLYRLTARLFDERAGLWAALLLNLAPVFTLSTASWILPEGPVDFFLLAGASVVARILVVAPEPRRPLPMWLAVGALGGLAMLSKYHGAFLFIGTQAFLLSVPSARRWLKSPGPWLGAAVALVLFLPVVIWNTQHDLSGLGFQLARLDKGSGISFARLLAGVGAQILYLAVWTFVPLVVGLVRAFRAGPRDQPSWLLALIAIGPIAAFTLATLWARGLPHWTAPGWLMAMPLAGAVAADWAARWPRAMRGAAVVAAGLMGLFIAAAAGQVMTGWLTRLVPALARADVTRDIIDWHELRPALERGGLLSPGAVVAAPHWIEAGKTSYALGPDVTVLCLCDRPQHFAYRYDLADYAGRDAVLIARHRGPEFDAGFGRYFDTVEPVAQPVEIHRLDGSPAFALDIAIGHGLRARPSTGD